MAKIRYVHSCGQEIELDDRDPELTCLEHGGITNVHCPNKAAHGEGHYTEPPENFKWKTGNKAIDKAEHLRKKNK